MNRPIPYGRHHIDEEDIAAVTRVLREGLITQGPLVEEFERAVAQYVGARHAVAIANGTAALHLACLAAGLGEGDTAVTSPNTFVASANCARYVGASVALADIDPDTLNLDPEALSERCKRLGRVGAVIPVHFAGLPCRTEEIATIARRHGAKVIEDAAHALGATYPDGSRVGNCAHSDATVFSFHPVKLIATGEGGMVTTNDSRIHRNLLRLRSHGINKADDAFQIPEQAGPADNPNPWYYEMQELGYNFRITDIQCALGLSQFRKLERFLARRRELAAVYDRAFDGVPHLTCTQVATRARSANHLYVLRIDFAGLGIERGELMRRLRSKRIITQVHYIPVHRHPYYQRLGLDASGLPNAERYYAEALSIPLFFSLSDDEQKLVVDSLLGAVRAA